MLNGEIVSPDRCVAVLESRIEELVAAREILQKRLKKSPSGRLRVATRKGALGEVFRYYHVQNAENSGGTYIPKEFLDDARVLAQKDYALLSVEELTREISVLNQCLALYHPERLVENYCSLHRGRIDLVEPVQYPDAEFAKRWQAVAYKGLDFNEDYQELYTSRGERVRSKSEVIIAETLVRFGIPYRYEFPLEMSLSRNKKTVFHPDFLCLNVRTHREYVWEHLGLMDDPMYVRNAMGKLDVYEANGYVFGENLIFTREYSDSPLTVKQVEMRIKKYMM